MQTLILFVRQGFWSGLALLLGGSALACGASTDEESDRSEGSVIASAEGILDPTDANRGGFVNEVELSVGVRGTKFEPTRGQPFWEIGKACKSNRRECNPDDFAPDTNIVGKITFEHNDVTLFEKTSFVQWDDVSLKKGDSLEYRWAFLAFGASGPENDVAMAWFIDDTGKLVDIVILSTKNLLAEKSVNQTSWTDGSWEAKESFHGSVRFSLSAGYYYNAEPERPFSVSWPTGTLLLDKTVSVKSAESGTSKEVIRTNDCTIETSLQTVQTVCSGE